MKYSTLFTTCSLILLSFSLFSQETWSLERCIRHAIDNSLTVRNATLNADIAEVNLRQARHQRLPSLNASTNAGLNFGRVINPATNNFETDNSIFTSMGMSSGMMLFQGGLINNSIRQNIMDMDASELDVQQTTNNLALQVALSYLSVVFAEENLINAEARLRLSQAQLDQVEKMIRAGSIPEADRYDVVAQIALDEQDIVRLNNDREINMLNLKQLMLIDPTYPMQLERPDVARAIAAMEGIESNHMSTVYNTALATQPQIRAQDIRIRSAETGESIVRAQMVPRLVAGASIGTNYSDLSKRILGFETVRIPTPGVYINGQPTLFEIDQSIPSGFETTPFIDQLDNNLGYGVSLSLSIPIYNNYSTRSALARAKVFTEQQKTAGEQIRQTLKTDIQNALAAARAARESLKASERALDAAEIAYQNADRRFALGTINNYDLISARNRLDTARVNQTVAKFDYLFRAKVIEFYLGRGLIPD